MELRGADLILNLGGVQGIAAMAQGLFGARPADILVGPRNCYVADRYAPEHLQVQAEDLDWSLGRLTAYGSLFLGPEATVSFGDKTSGPTHVPPTSGGARSTGWLSVHKFTRAVTWRRCTARASHELAGRTARISRSEGMEGHARAAELRLDRG